MSDTIIIGADNDVVLRGIQNRQSGAYLNAATVTWELRSTPTGSAIASGTANYEAASNGNYNGVIDASDTVNLTNNARYYVAITIEEGGVKDFRLQTKTAKYRGVR